MNNGRDVDDVDDDLSMMLMAMKAAGVKKKETTVEAKREKLRELLCLLEERLAQHDENRKEVQRELKDTCAKIVNDTDSTEDQTGGEILRDFEKKEEGILELIEKLKRRKTTGEGYGDLKRLIKEALTTEYKYEIRRYCFVDSYELVATPVKSKVAEGVCLDYAADSIETIIGMLEEHLDRMRKSMNSAYERLGGICGGRRQTAEELDESVNRVLGESFATEDARLQRVVNLVREGISSESGEELERLCKRARATLLLIQKYSLNTNNINKKHNNINNINNLIITQEASLGSIEFEKRQPADIAVTFPDKGLISLSFTFFNDLELKVFESLGNPHNVTVSAWVEGMGEDAGATITKKYTPWACDDGIRFNELLAAETTYCLKMRLEYNGSCTRWSEEIEFVTPEFDKLCAWKECPDYVDEKSTYGVDKENPGIATTIGQGDHTVIGNTLIPFNKVTSWSVKILESKNNDGDFIYIGVAPFDINQNENCNCDYCGWYFGCYSSVLKSGPPHDYRWKEYGPRKKEGQYVHPGDSVGVVMDTTKGELSFALNGANLGLAFEGIPLDKPLVPCVVLGSKGDSVELDISEVKETVVDSSVPVPLNFVVNRISWDLITLTWDEVIDASFYQVEVDGSKFWDPTIENSFTKKDFLPDTEHSFRVRVVRGSSVSEWSGVVKGRTLKAPEFSECVWKKCPDDVIDQRKYVVDEKNPRVATKVNGGRLVKCSTIIGSTYIPLNKVTSWSIKILKSEDNDGGGIFIGIAPRNITQDSDNNYYKCGWYFRCYGSELCSGPPHNYDAKEHGPRKGYGQYVHTGDSVGVVVDTIKGELSFVLNGVNLGVAYEGIPLDKPLVPCVLLRCEGDSVELMI